MFRNWSLRFASRVTKLVLRNLLLKPQEFAANSTIDKVELESVLTRLNDLVVQAQDTKRRIAAEATTLPHAIFSYDRKDHLSISVKSKHSPWLNTAPRRMDTPSMISREEEQYYAYIGRFYQGIGFAVELGPWLGASTRHIVESLAKNPYFSGKRLYVFDDFVWRASWMDQHVSEAERLPNQTSFRHLFDKYTCDIADLLRVERVKITDHDGNEALPLLSWNAQNPIEFLYVDCGRTIEANAAWYKCLRPAFIPRRTLIMMQDWGVHREVPRKWINQTLFFTEEHENELKLIHEMSSGTLATFLFDPIT
jgi:hypothetical protein